MGHAQAIPNTLSRRPRPRRVKLEVSALQRKKPRADGPSRSNDEESARQREARRNKKREKAEEDAKTQEAEKELMLKYQEDVHKCEGNSKSRV